MISPSRPIPSFIIQGFPVPIPILDQLRDSPVTLGLGIGSPSGTGFIAIPKHEDMIAQLEVLGPRLFTVEALTHMREINKQEIEKLDRLRTMLDESQARLCWKW
nr:hypothetical protein [Tanacetum cinerariifolium]